MKKILILAILLSIGLSSATSDQEILQFASGVLAGSIFTGTAEASINNDTLVLVDKLSKYSDKDPSTIGFNLYNLISAAETVTTKYPGRFAIIEAKLYDIGGSTLIGSIVVGVKN